MPEAYVKVLVSTRDVSSKGCLKVGEFSKSLKNVLYQHQPCVTKYIIKPNYIFRIIPNDIFKLGNEKRGHFTEGRFQSITVLLCHRLNIN